MMIKILRAAFLMAALAGLLSAQAPAIKKAYLGQPMSDFELGTLDSKTIKLSALKGKNVMLVFPRVFYATDGDCSICGYQYVELADFYLKGDWKDKFNLEILYVFPFSAEVTRNWLSRLPVMLAAVEEWKNPKAEDLKNEKVAAWMELARRAYPRKYAVTAGNITMPFPILIDEKRELSTGLDLFREEWSGGKGDQNIPSLFILDREGIVRFKFIGQHTVDRPSAEYLEKIMKAVL